MNQKIKSMVKKNSPVDVMFRDLLQLISSLNKEDSFRKFNMTVKTSLPQSSGYFAQLVHHLLTKFAACEVISQEKLKEKYVVRPDGDAFRESPHQENEQDGQD